MDCPICFEKDKWITKTPCNHKICIDCIVELSKNICPFCRKKNVFDTLPIVLKRNCKMFRSFNKEDKNITTSGVNVDSFYDFPPLS